MQATHRALVNLNPLLTQTARTAHIFPHLKSGALISIGQLWDDGCTETSTSTHLNVVKYGITVLEVTWLNTSGMWKVNLTRNPDHLSIQKQPAARNDLTV